MSQKTELPAAEARPELSNPYLGSLVVASAIVLLLVFWGSSVLNPLTSFHISGAGPMLYPWIIGGAQTISNGLTEFSGHPLTQADNLTHIASLISILFAGILAPTLTLLLMGKNSSAVGRGVYLVSLIVTATVAITVLPTGYIAYRVRLSLREAQAVQTNRDFIINELNTIAWKLREYRILPKSLGGGENSNEGYVLPASQAETEDATYVIRLARPGTNEGSVPIIGSVHATSKKYPGAEVDVSVREHGELFHWTYTGRFQ
jgi:hypothetical protein